jgi:hypothetical protein
MLYRYRIARHPVLCFAGIAKDCRQLLCQTAFMLTGKTEAPPRHGPDKPGHDGVVEFVAFPVSLKLLWRLPQRVFGGGEANRRFAQLAGKALLKARGKNAAATRARRGRPSAHRLGHGWPRRRMRRKG